MAEKLSKKEEKELRDEREDLLIQAEAFLEENDYELLTELFAQIAEISSKLGENDIANDFNHRAAQIRILLDAPDEPAILENPYPSTPDYSIPRAPSLPSSMLETLDPPQYIDNTSPSTPQVPSSSTPTGQVPQRGAEKLQQLKSLAGSIIGQRRSKQGSVLASGIIPTIVRDEREVILEILNEKLPLMPEKLKEDALKKILEHPVGPKRDAWLKVFLIKNKQYSR